PLRTKIVASRPGAFGCLPALFIAPGVETMKRAHWAGALVAGLVLAYPLCLGVAWMRVWFDGDGVSRSVGGVADGRVENAKEIPLWGEGYTTYSMLGAALGRQYVDGRVRDALIEAFAVRARAEPGRVFVVGETGWP